MEHHISKQITTHKAKCYAPVCRTCSENMFAEVVNHGVWDSAHSRELAFERL